ncbi:MAG: hypothetical protein WB473_10040, partial [Pedococcus sp.]
EDDAAYDELTRLGCDQAQGFHMSRPVPAAELDQWLDTRDATETLQRSSALLPAVPSGPSR